MKNVFFVIAALIVCCTAIPVHAEPTPAIRYLMDEPVSMFDFGMLRIETCIKEILLSRYEMPQAERLNESSIVNYDWDKNRIKILITVSVPTRRLSRISAKGYCRMYTQRVRTQLNSFIKEKYRDEVGIFQYFSHYGYKINDEPKNLMKEIENITYIYVDILEQMDKGVKISATSESPLLGDEILFLNK